MSVNLSINLLSNSHACIAALTIIPKVIPDLKYKVLQITTVAINGCSLRLCNKTHLTHSILHEQLQSELSLAKIHKNQLVVVFTFVQ